MTNSALLRNGKKVCPSLDVLTYRGLFDTLIFERNKLFTNSPVCINESIENGRSFLGENLRSRSREEKCIIRAVDDESEFNELKS